MSSWRDMEGKLNAALDAVALDSRAYSELSSKELRILSRDYTYEAQKNKYKARELDAVLAELRKRGEAS